MAGTGSRTTDLQILPSFFPPSSLPPALPYFLPLFIYLFLKIISYAGVDEKPNTKRTKNATSLVHEVMHVKTKLISAIEFCTGAGFMKPS